VHPGIGEASCERLALDDELDVEADQQDLVEHPDDQLVLADGDAPHRAPARTVSTADRWLIGSKTRLYASARGNVPTVSGLHIAALVVSFVTAAATPGSAGPARTSTPPCAACVAPAVEAGDAGALLAMGPRLDGVDLVFDGPPPGHDARAALAAVGARLWVTLQAPADDADAGNAAGAWVVAPARGSTDELVFAVRTAATNVRARSPGALVGLVLDDRMSVRSTARALAPYVDVVRFREPWPPDAPAVAELFPGAEVWRDATAPDLLGVEGGASSRVVLHAAERLRAVAQVAAARHLLVPGLTPLPEVGLSCEGCAVSTFLQPDTLHAIAVVEAAAPVLAVRAGVPVARAAFVDLDDPQGPAPLDVSPGRVHLPGAGRRRFVLDLAGWRGTDEEPLRDVVRVSAARRLTVEEILARHQAWRARQRDLVRSVITAGTTVVTFEVPGFAGPATVTATTRTFRRGALVEMEQRDIRMNGVDMQVEGKAPTLPIIEPERVMTPPLVIALGASYGYRLEGREQAAGRDCYVVSFTPLGTEGTSFAGRAWIEAGTFALVRMDAAQTGLRGAIVSSRQRDEFSPVRVDDRDAWLPARSTIDQIYQAAGFRTPIHREVTASAHEVNAADFDARREAALRSPAVILRDTLQGFQYLVPAPEGTGGGPRVPAPRAGRRVVTAAFGVIDDPNITDPLPYAGLSYLDFDLFGRGIQLSAFFGGTYGQAAWTIPGAIRRGWQLTGRALGIAVSYNDRSFRDGVEQYDENVLQRPAHVDTTFVIPLSPRTQLRAGYEFDYAAYAANDDTAMDFVVPADSVVHGARLGLDVQRGSWSALGWWLAAYRQGWKPWGFPDTTEYTQESASFQKYGVTVARAWVLSPGSVARVEGAWVGGHDLDRFSRYTVDGFDNRLRGYPSASLRYDRGAILRSVATWTPVPRLRLDGAADLALVHDPGFGPGLKSYPGLGANAEVPLPARFLLAVEWGYGFNARNSDGSLGTQVVRVAGVKVF
jgi:hypothetical protein